jgi:hypothetical protein
VGTPTAGVLPPKPVDIGRWVTFARDAARRDGLWGCTAEATDFRMLQQATPDGDDRLVLHETQRYIVYTDYGLPADADDAALWEFSKWLVRSPTRLSAAAVMDRFAPGEPDGNASLWRWSNGGLPGVHVPECALVPHHVHGDAMRDSPRVSPSAAAPGGSRLPRSPT